MDNLLAVLIIVAAAAYLLRRWLKPSKKPGGGCPGCSGCSDLMAKNGCGHSQAGRGGHGS
ncbi:MAG: FeoB-associated Cys-rich membrane protein [Desulfovibrionaceae bacterium]